MVARIRTPDLADGSLGAPPRDGFISSTVGGVSVQGVGGAAVAFESRGKGSDTHTRTRTMNTAATTTAAACIGRRGGDGGGVVSIGLVETGGGSGGESSR